MTLTGTILLPSGAARTSLNVFFDPLSTLYVKSGNSAVSTVQVKAVTNGSGVFSIALEAGIYLMSLGDVVTGDRKYVCIPSGSGTVTLEDVLEFTFSSRSNASLLFTRSDYVAQGEYVGGRFRFATDAQLINASLTAGAASAGGESSEFTLEVDGTLTALKFTVAAGVTSAELDLVSTALLAGKYCRFKCTSGPSNPANLAGGINISVNAAVNQL